VVGVIAHDAAQLVLLQQRIELVPVLGIGLVVAQVQGHVGSALGAVDVLDGEVAAAFGRPADAFRGRQARAAALDHDALRDDERRIEAHAELADEIGVLGGVAGQPAEELPRAGAGDGAEIGDRLFAAQADAVVRDPDRAGLAVDGDADLQLGVAGIERVVVDGLEAQLVAGIRRIGDQLAQEDLAVAVERVDHEIEQLLDLGLESKCLFVGVCH
jgi:hypothetical protein